MDRARLTKATWPRTRGTDSTPSAPRTDGLEMRGPGAGGASGGATGLFGGGDGTESEHAQHKEQDRDDACHLSSSNACGVIQAGEFGVLADPNIGGGCSHGRGDKH